MMKYERPIIQINSETAEGVYAASGATKDCDSEYMNGVWQAPDYSTWPTTVKQRYGCLGCPAYTWSGCGVATGNHYDQSGNSGSYDTDTGSRKPEWERRELAADRLIDDTHPLPY